MSDSTSASSALLCTATMIEEGGYHNAQNGFTRRLPPEPRAHRIPGHAEGERQEAATDDAERQPLRSPSPR